MLRCPECGGLMETDDVNDADYVVLGHVVCGRPCYEAGYALQLDLFPEPDPRSICLNDP